MTAVWAVIVALLPGALAAGLIPRGRERWVALAAAPVVSAGLLAACLAWLPLTGLPDGPIAMLVAQLVLAAALAGFAAIVARRQRMDPAAPTGAGPCPRRRDVVAASVSAVIAAAYGVVLVRGLPTTPGWDAMNHAFFVRRILDSGHATIQAACVTGGTAPHVICDFYPIGADVTWAQDMLLGGGSMSAAMNTDAAIVAPVALVLGTFALIRYLGARTLPAAAASLVTAFVGPLWPTFHTGRINEMLGPAFAPGAALLIAAAVRGRHRGRMGVLAALASAGMVMTHTYETIIVIPLALAAMVAAPSLPDAKRPRGVRHTSAGVVTGVAGTTVLLAPFVSGILGTPANAILYWPVFRGHPLASFRFWVTNLARYAPVGLPTPTAAGPPLRNLALMALAATIAVGVGVAVPASLTRRVRWALPFVVAWAVLTGLGVWTGTSVFAAKHVGVLWYNENERLRTIMIPVLGVMTVAGWYAIGLLAAGLLRRVRGHVRVARFGLPATASLAIAGAVVAAAWSPQELGHLRATAVAATPQGAQYERVYAWLKSHITPGQSVAFDRNIDFLAWAYGIDDVPPLNGPTTHAGPGLADYNARRQVISWLQNAPKAKPAGCLVQHYGVKYVAVGPPKLLLTVVKATINRDDLAKSPNVRLVHSDNGILVYEVTAAGSACPAE